MTNIVHTLQTGTWAYLRRNPETETTTCACVPILNAHLHPHPDGGWTLPRSIHKPADRDVIHLLAADLLDRECRDCPSPNISIAPWITPQEETLLSQPLQPSAGSYFRPGELKPLDLVRDGRRWVRIASANKRTYTVNWGDHCRALYKMKPMEIQEAARPRRNLLTNQTGKLALPRGH
ncbi:hypothetical protein [Nonomuraea sp. SYSU D8015]|uniref:hypothetical protein n=1 Tax=Nonomuraea sp. SYSU D8015 TaxID=2593644 RepID=UPI0016617DD8|nr:hypothetical protein [Nonomuraea sp. SYSU D8015]